MYATPIVREEVSFPSPKLHVPLSSPPPRPLAFQTNPSLHVYQQSQYRHVVLYSPAATSSLSEVPASSTSPPEIDDLPIALRQ